MKKKICVVILSIFLSFLIVALKNGFSQSVPGQNHGMPQIVKMKDIDNLYIGSSLIKMGIDSTLIGENDFVLAYNGNEPSNIIRELEFLMKKNVKIKRLYVDMYTWTVSRGAWIDDLKILWDCDFPTILNIYKDLTNNSLRYAYEFFVSANNDYLFTYPISVNLFNRYHYKGGNISSFSGKTADELDQMELPSSTSEATSIKQEQIDAIKNIKKLCKENGIELTFIETPKYEKEANWDTYIESMDRYKELLDSLGIDYVVVEQLDFPNEEADYFVDLIHLSSSGKAVYTKKLLDFLNK